VIASPARKTSGYDEGASPGPRANARSVTLSAPPRSLDCPLCPAGTRSSEVTVRWGVRIVRCTGCGLVFANPQPTDEVLEDYYGPEYFQKNADKFLEFPLHREVELRLRRYLRELARVAPAGRVLDVGCGTGTFLLLAKEAGYSGTGVELSAYAAELGRQKLGVAIRTGRLEELRGETPFEAITMWDFLEHTREPLEILRCARRQLAPGGHLLMTVPNVGSWWANAMGPRWVGFDKASEHLFYFTRGSLRRMLTLAGFEPLRVEPHSWICSASFLADRGAKAWPQGGRLFKNALTRLGMQERVVRFPSVNLLAVARKSPG
jgi:SAM-dependent methyltransferase